MPAILTRGLTRRYGSTVAVDGLDLSVEKGQVLGLVGPNGSGKTTTIGMLLGLVSPTAGECRLLEGGRRGPGVSPGRIGATIDPSGFYPYLTAAQNLHLSATIKGAPPGQVEEVLELVGLSDRRDTRYRQFSEGMKRRLGLAAALLGEPEVLILDEPTSGMDPNGLRMVREAVLARAERGAAVLVSSHILSEVETTCSHVAFIAAGRLVAAGEMGELLSDTAIAEVMGPRAEDLRTFLESYEGAGNVRLDGDVILADVKDADLSHLARDLARQELFPSHLRLRPRRLEELFIDLTRGDGDER